METPLENLQLLSQCHPAFQTWDSVDAVEGSKRNQSQSQSYAALKKRRQ